MRDDILFSERQLFRQWWIWLILFIPLALLAYGVYIQVFRGETFGDEPVSNAGLLAIFLLIVLINIFFSKIRMDTMIRKDGIHVRFFPFHWSFRKYGWDEIQKAYTRTYKPLLEYGGWGIRGFRKNRAFNVSGNMGLQLEFKNGHKLLIGSQKTNEIDDVLRKLRSSSTKFSF